MSRVRAFVTLLFIAAVLVASRAASVAASPSNENTYYVEMRCPAVGEIFTLAIVDRNSVARHIVSTTDKVILASVVGEATFEGVVVPIDFSPSEQRLKLQDLTTCYVDDSFVLPKSGVSIAVDVTVQALLTPRWP